MDEFLKGLPPAITVGVLVAVFVALRRHYYTPRVHYWVVGWSVMFAHFIVNMTPATSRFWTWFLTAASLACLQVAGLAFLISMTRLVQVRRLGTGAFLLMAIPLVVYSGMVAASSTNRLAYGLLATWTFFGAAIWYAAWYRKFSLYVVTSVALLAALGILALVHVRAGNPMGGFYTILLAMYLLCGILFARHYRRATAGVSLACGGFFTWAAIWFCGAMFPGVISAIGAGSELWNVPKIFVAIGMIVTILEQQSLAANAAGERERMLNVQMARFADITSRLLSGAEVSSLCDEIAHVITEVANFRRVVILLPDERGRMLMGGDAGLDAETRETLSQKLADFTPDAISKLCASGRKIGTNSYICSGEAARQYGAVSSVEHYGNNTNWHDGDELLVPLHSSQGAIIGCISLDDPREVDRVTREEMSSIEMLASDLAVAIGNATLQRRIVLQEKMASVGQLVSGVAHELNNPLTAVMGYTELLADSDTEGRIQRELEIIKREARRMKTIIDNLLRFARQAKTETKSANVQQVFQEALNLRDYDLKRQSIDVERDLPSDLPAVAVDEAQLKTVVVHLLSNASDAVQNSQEKRISVHARQVGERIIVSVLDTGCGFPDTNRAFDPFFTTKAPGRGPGLGLSICYGIIRQHGGDIYARNATPTGACVTMELPTANHAHPAQVHAASLGMRL